MTTFGLGPDAATLPTVSDTCPLYEQVNMQVGLDAWLAEPGREHEAISITGIQQMRFSDVTIGDLLQAAPGTAYSNAGVGAPVAMNLPCGPDGQRLTWPHRRTVQVTCRLVKEETS